MMFGGVVYQILKPINDKLLPTWDMQLKTQGPGIHNLSLQINGANKFREKLIERGVKEVNYWPKAIDLGAAGYSVDGLLDAYLFDATKECGFRFEFIESQPEWEPGEQE